MENLKIYAIIPARSGSTRVPNKNILEVNGKPLLAHSIVQAKESKYIDRIILSTDSEEYAEIGSKYGAEVPFIRPSEISGKLATDIEFFQHAHRFFCEKEERPDLYVLLRPTSPIRPVGLIDKLIEIFKDKTNYSSLRTYSANKICALKSYTIKNETAVPIVESIDGVDRPYDSPVQVLPQTYQHNGLVDIVWSSTIEKGTNSGDKIFPYITDEFPDIDTEEDLRNLFQNWTN
jgi:CMP-N,N'-diacetyllegionaminic acid synthase